MKKLLAGILLLFSLACSMQVMAQNGARSFIFDSGESSVKDTKKISLSGIWQLCVQFQPRGNDKYLVRTGPYMKVLSADKTFVNMFLDTYGGPSVITAMGTYKRTSDSTYVESIFRSVTDPISGKDMDLKYKFVGPNILVINYKLPNNPNQSQEIWMRVIQPDMPSNFNRAGKTQIL